ncbi:NgoFVII family restriction endonuclease [candidate division KSB1 bacterium]|nr:NgoFVII family restriction endonuclease [candidate division KSB1 bacterium]
MKLITDSKSFEQEFLRLLDNYSNYYWLSAWAGVGFPSFKKLLNNRKKIARFVIGIHFYQTHPDFIEAFLESDKVKYVIQPEGTFHPKLFIFYNSKADWEIIIGSANFTNAAFTINTEISAVIYPKDSNAKEILSKSFEIINSFWIKSKYFNISDLESYRKTWENHRPKINSLSGKYGNDLNMTYGKNKPIFQIPVANMEWHEFVDKVNNEKNHPLSSRLQVLELVKSLFRKVDSFNKLNVDERKFIAGIPNNLRIGISVDWGYFGSMKGAGIFKNRIIKNDSNISNALDEIPISGQITKMHYRRFLDYFTRAFKGNYLATATRLLAMKRPDVFICLNSKNKSALCKNFGIVQKGLEYERYWDEIIERIYDSQWWQNPKPENKTEKKISDARAAFLDSLYYVK